MGNSINKELKSKSSPPFCGACFTSNKKLYKKITNTTDLGECSICLCNMDTLDDSDLTPKWMICGHVFHQGCIDKWFDTSSDCPLCGINQHLHNEYIDDIIKCTIENSDINYNPYILHNDIINEDSSDDIEEQIMLQILNALG